MCFFEKGVGNNGFGRIIVYLIVQPVNGTEIGYAAFGADTRASEKDYVIRTVDNCLKLLNICHFQLTFPRYSSRHSPCSFIAFAASVPTYLQCHG